MPESPEIVELVLPPKEANDPAILSQKALQKAGKDAATYEVKLLRRSIDARQRPVFRLRVGLYPKNQSPEGSNHIGRLQSVANAPEVLVVGAGPAGYFAALELIEQGLKPIVLDRGKPVRDRRRDLRAIQQFGEVNPNSNYCFGEGGAGTYSDGKLYTRSVKRGNALKVLELLVEHGAQEDILIDAHPHIGSNKLPKIVSNIRETILQLGGEVHFDAKVTNILIEDLQIQGVVVNSEHILRCDHLILATGHSARDIFQLLADKGVEMHSKPFALGIRVEHPQALIDQFQYRQSPREENLPASSYRLVAQSDDRGVFSFCMCPGGLIVPAATQPGELVVNGMSMSRRDSKFANSGIVVAIELEDLESLGFTGLFAAMDFQRSVEQSLFQHGDGSQKAPAQRLTDFLKNRTSKSVNPTSYIPGLYSAPMHELLPSLVVKRLQAGFRQFDRKMKGYVTDQANIIGVESRTSSPIRIPRDKDTRMHPQVKGLFPCGEGAGYAGGILSAAMDGQNVARSLKQYYKEEGKRKKEEGN
ncbi:MAG: FAD-dependent protein [Bacteroidota bacterium]